MTDHDPVDHPSHYTAYPVEVIELTEHLNFCRGNAVKYLARAGLKGGPQDEIQDLKKARWYIDREITRCLNAAQQPGPTPGPTSAVKTWEFDDTAQPRIEERNERAVELGKKYAEDIVTGAERIFQPRREVYGDIAPPTSAKMRHCVGCGGSHPLTAFAGRLVEHWDPATLSNIPGPTICDQRERKAEQ